MFTPGDVIEAGNAAMDCLLWTDGEMLREELGHRPDEMDLAEGIGATLTGLLGDFIADADAAGWLDKYIEAGGNFSQLGHDFILTANRHGAGFWDRGLGEVGTALTNLAHPYGEISLYAGDDNLIYLNG